MSVFLKRGGAPNPIRMPAMFRAQRRKHVVFGELFSGMDLSGPVFDHRFAPSNERWPHRSLRFVTGRSTSSVFVRSMFVRKPQHRQVPAQNAKSGPLL